MAPELWVWRASRGGSLCPGGGRRGRFEGKAESSPALPTRGTSNPNTLSGVGGGALRRRWVAVPPEVRSLRTNRLSALVAEQSGCASTANLTTAQKNVDRPMRSVPRCFPASREGESRSCAHAASKIVEMVAGVRPLRREGHASTKRRKAGRSTQSDCRSTCRSNAASTRRPSGRDLRSWNKVDCASTVSARRGARIVDEGTAGARMLVLLFSPSIARTRGALKKCGVRPARIATQFFESLGKDESVFVQFLSKFPEELRSFELLAQNNRRQLDKSFQNNRFSKKEGTQVPGYIKAVGTSGHESYLPISHLL